MGNGPLHRVQTEQRARELIQAGASVQGTNGYGETPLHRLAGHANVVASSKIAAVLLDNGADVNARDRNGDTPLHIVSTAAKSNEMVSFTEFLVAKGADVGATNSKGFTPLHKCYGPNEESRTLIRLGANPYAGGTNSTPINHTYTATYEGPQKPVTEVAFIDASDVEADISGKLAKSQASMIPMLTVAPRQGTAGRAFDQMKASIRSSKWRGVQVVPGHYDVGIIVHLLVMGGGRSIYGKMPAGRMTLDAKPGVLYRVYQDTEGTNTTLKAESLPPPPH